jgi:hypothetical protein
VEVGPGSTIACCPPASSSAAAIECGRPAQFMSSVVMAVIFLGCYETSAVRTTLRLHGISPRHPTYRQPEYSKQMPWRRILGGALASLLLLSVAFPAMCGNCFQAASAESCGEKHGATRHHSDTSMDVKCPVCDSEVQAVTATITSTAADLLNSTNSPNRCAQVAVEPAPLADIRISASRYAASNDVLAGSSSHNIVAFVPLASQSTAILANAQPPRTSALALASILKI